MFCFPISISLLLLVSNTNGRHLPELVDLCHSYENNTVFSYPTPLETRITAFSTWLIWQGVTPSGVWFQVKEFDSKEHGGTHIDAPAHFFEGLWTVDQIPIDRLVNVPAVIIDIRDKAARVLDATVDVSDLEQWEYLYGPIEEGSVVLLFSGWDKFYGNFTQYTATLDGANSADYHFPGFSLEAAKWLAKKNIYAIGTDAASVDVGKSTQFEVHAYLLALNLYLIENMTNLEKLWPPTGWKLQILPVKLKGGTGAPTRIIAVRDNQHYRI